MQFTTFVRKPFVVEAVEVTKDNISEVAKYVGDLRQKEDGTPYILVDPRLVPNVPDIFRVYPGFFMNFCIGNAVKYLWRADLKNGVEDLRKAVWYIQREISRRENV